MVTRTRLLDLLRARWRVPVTVLSAPAGYGKTTLLAQALAVNAAAPVGVDCWLTCEPDDASRSSLAEGLLGALAAAGQPGGPGTGREEGDRGGPGTGSEEGDPGSAGAEAVGDGDAGIAGSEEGDPTDAGRDAAQGIGEAMWRWSPTQVSLVVDDVHEVAAGSAAADLLDRVVRGLPANGHLVLCGRGPPPVPTSRIELAGQLVRLDERDLAFTAGELEDFARARGVADDRLDASGGWPALAELGVSAGPAGTADYLAEEVLSRTRATPRQLAVLAHLGPVDADVAAAALGESVDLDDLLAGVPLVARGRDGTCTLHGLWRGLLARELDADEVAAARHRAARALRGNGRSVAAVRVLLDRGDADDAGTPCAGDADDAGSWDTSVGDGDGDLGDGDRDDDGVGDGDRDDDGVGGRDVGDDDDGVGDGDLDDAIVDVLGAAHPPVARDVLSRWCDRLPSRARAGPGGLLLAAVAAGDTDPVSAAGQLDAAATAFRDRGHRTGELACLVQLGHLAWWSEDRARLVALVARVFELEREGCAAAVPLACLGRALVADVQNDARVTLAELDRIPPGSLNDLWQAIVSWLRSTSSMHLGDARAALAAADAAVARAGRLHRPLAEGARLQARWFMGEVDAVAAALPELVERTFASGRRNHAALAASQCALAHALLGHPAPAAEHLARARGAAGPSPAPLVDSHLSIAAAALAIATGDGDGAALLLAEHLTRQPLSTGHSAAPQQRSLALLYVLLPTTRPVWDAADLGPAFSVARDLARAVAGLHDGAALPPDVPALPAPGIVRAHLPRRWAAELATTLADAARQDGWHLLEALWPAARPDVVALAEHEARPVRAAARAALARLAVPPRSPFDLRLLGSPELRQGGEAVTAPEWRRERVRSLLGYLVLHPTTRRGQVADDLWPALDAEAQSRNLRVTLTYLLRVLEPERTPRAASFFVRQEGNQLRLHAGDHLDVDVWAFDALADRAEEADRRGAPAAALDHALGAVQLWRSDPTELAGEPWAVPLVERRRLRFGALATRAGELLLAKGAVDGARALAERALAVDAWSEGAHRLVVAAHRAAGDDVAARRALGRFRGALDELGVAPAEATSMVARLLETGPEIDPVSGRLAGR